MCGLPVIQERCHNARVIAMIKEHCVRRVTMMNCPAIKIIRHAYQIVRIFLIAPSRRGLSSNGAETPIEVLAQSKYRKSCVFRQRTKPTLRLTQYPEIVVENLCRIGSVCGNHLDEVYRTAVAAQSGFWYHQAVGDQRCRRTWCGTIRHEVNDIWRKSPWITSRT